MCRLIMDLIQASWQKTTHLPCSPNKKLITEVQKLQSTDLLINVTNTPQTNCV